MDTGSVSLESGEREPTAEEWQAVLIQVFDEDDLLEATVAYFLRRSKSGKAYLKELKRLRPQLEIGPELDLAEITMTYDSMKLLRQLIEEPRCGTDPTFWVWKDVWKNTSFGVPEYYEYAIEIARTLERRSKSKAEKARLRQVRAALQNEFILETRFEDYRLFRKEAEGE